MHCKLQKFTSGGIESGGYSVAKFGNVVLTRMFPHFKPRPSDDGVKTYALCPFAVPTRLVLDGFGKDKSPEDAKREAAKMVFNATKSRETFRLDCKYCNMVKYLYDGKSPYELCHTLTQPTVVINLLPHEFMMLKPNHIFSTRWK